MSNSLVSSSEYEVNRCLREESPSGGRQRDDALNCTKSVAREPSACVGGVVSAVGRSKSVVAVDLESDGRGRCAWRATAATHSLSIVRLRRNSHQAG